MPSLEKLDRYSPMVVGALQAGGVTAYVLAFAWGITQLDSIEARAPEFASATFFLLAFVFSALICSSLALGYPALLAMHGKVGRAIKIVAWSALTFALILLLALVIMLTLAK